MAGKQLNALSPPRHQHTFLASTYLGLTNSAILPPVAVRTVPIKKPNVSGVLTVRFKSPNVSQQKKEYREWWRPQRRAQLARGHLLW
jgi:hypothetical protein